MATATDAPSMSLSSADAPFDLTVEVFGRMVEANLIPRERRVYLHDGRLYEKLAKSKAYGSVGAAITMTVALRLPTGWGLWPESTIALDRTHAPLPDFAVIRSGELMGRANPERYPGPGDVGLVIEIAVTSLRDDLTTALAQYTRALIPACWVVDVPGRRVLAHSEPRVVDGLGEYARVESYRAGEAVPVVLDGREVARLPVGDWLG